MATNKDKLNKLTPSAKKAGLGTKLDAMITLINELKNDVDALRVDFRKHDHGGTYAQQTMRINASAVTISGTETSSAVVSPAVDVLN